MTPIAATPNRGYIDYQRVSNYDSPLMDFSTAALTVSFTGAVQDVSRYAAFVTVTAPLAVIGYLTCQWSTDALLTNVVGQRTVPFDYSGLGAIIWRAPNLGPYVRAKWFNVSGVPGATLLETFATNRLPSPNEITPSTTFLIDKQSVAIGGAANSYHYPADYYAGPVQVWMNTSSSSLVLDFQALNIAGVYDSYNQIAVPAGNLTEVIITPVGAWRVHIANPGAATSYYLTVMASATGST